MIQPFSALSRLERSPLTPPYLILPPILHTICIAYRPSLPTRITVCMLISYLYLSIILEHTTGNMVYDYTLGNVCGAYFFTMIHHFFLTNPERDFRYKSDPNDDPRRLTFWRRLYWGLTIFLCPRGIGWNWQVRC